MENTFVARPDRGRVVTIARQVGLADVRPDSSVRLDAIARFLQDVADHDAVTAEVDGGLWVLRRLALRIDHTPRFRAELVCSTWCSGVGARWAERRTDLVFGEATCVQAAAIWVHVDAVTGAPARLPAGFDPLWGVSAQGRKVRANLRHTPPPPDVAPAALAAPSDRPRRARPREQRRVLGTRRGGARPARHATRTRGRDRVPRRRLWRRTGRHRRRGQFPPGSPPGGASAGTCGPPRS